MKENYKPWNIDIDEYKLLNNNEEFLRFLIKYGILAPSGHNTQPWKFSINDNKINVLLDSSRLLKVSDANDRQSYLSIGCLIKNIKIAANYFGYKAEAFYILDKKKIDPVVASIEIIKIGSDLEDKDHLIHFITKRVTNRGKYKQLPLPEHFNEFAKSFSTTEINVTIVTEERKKREIAIVALNAMKDAMTSRDFRNELALYFKNNLTRSKIGMPGFGMGIPLLLSFFVPYIIKFVNVAILNRKMDEDVFINHTPAYIMLSSNNDEPAIWLRIGEIFQELALYAERSGISLAPWQAPVQINDHYKKLNAIIDSKFRPQFLMRAGTPFNKDVKHSPRLPIEEVII
jgi:hypothetical protein